MKPHPKAPNWKRALYALYLVQPVLQFLLLAFAITALNRCSPLSPSSNKSPLKDLLGNSRSESDGTKALLSANWIEQSLKLIGEAEMAVTSEQAVHDEVKSIQDIRADVSRFIDLEPNATAQVLRAPALLIKIKPSDVQRLISEGLIRHNLSESLAQLNPDEANEALLRLRDQPELVNASALLVLPSDRLEQHEDAKIHLRIAVAILDAQHAVLQITHRLAEESPEKREPRQQALNSAALDAKHLAIIID